MKFLNDIISLIEESIYDSSYEEESGFGIIRAWYDSVIDEYRSIIEWGHTWVSNYQQSLQETYNSKSIKVKFTSTVWYYIEIPRSFDVALLSNLEHKQTLTWVHRYSSHELEEFEEKISKSELIIQEREREIISENINFVKIRYNKINNLSKNIAFFDFLYSGAYYSQIYACCNAVFSKKKSIDMCWAKHPVVQAYQKDFVSNDAHFSWKNRIQIITGPNMWWKSTYLRQNALLLICAHIGYDVSATSFETPIIDKIFSRVWASDNIMLGQSTFMLEMQEIAYILRSSTKNSFVIIDEIGRGTSTSDWLALAWSILRFIHDDVKCMWIFATHYHEIIDLSVALSWCQNFSVAVWENEDNLVFLRKVIPWGMKKSYGIEVAKLAGVHKNVLEIAKVFQYDSWIHSSHQLSLDVNRSVPDLSALSPNEKKVLSSLKEIDLDSITPLDLMNIFSEIKQQLKK